MEEKKLREGSIGESEVRIETARAGKDGKSEGEDTPPDAGMQERRSVRTELSRARKDGNSRGEDTKRR